MTPSDTPASAAKGENPLARAFTTIESVGHEFPEYRIATIKMRFEGDGAAERAHTALNYLSRLHEAASSPASAVKGEGWAFGAGRLVVDTGTYHGQAAVFVCPVASPGPVGESSAHLGHDRYSLQQGGAEAVLAYLNEHQPRCYNTTEGNARRTAFEEIRAILATLTSEVKG